MADAEYKSTLDDSDVLKALKRDEKAVKGFADTASKELGKVDKSVDKLSTGFGGKLKKNILAIGVALAGLGITAQKAFQQIQESVTGLRTERAFFSLAAAADQSGNDIIAAMDRAAAGTISRLELMNKANLALQLGVAKTPAEFEKLTKSAIVLGRALGKDALSSLEDLITAAGRKSVLILDNLGISADAVRARMQGLAEVEFGKGFDQLEQGQKDALFLKAALDEAAFAAEKAGGNIDDLGASLERAGAGFDDFKQEAGELGIIIAGVADDLFQFVSSDLLGITQKGRGFFQALADGARAWQSITIDAISLVSGVFNGFVQGAKAAAEPLIDIYDGLAKALTGDFSGLGAARDAAFSSSAGQLAKDFDEAFRQGLKDEFNDTRDELRDRYEQILDPQAAIDPAQNLGQQTGEAITDATVEAIEDGADDIAKAQDKAARSREDQAIKNGQRLIDVEIDTERDRLAILRDSARDAVDAERDRLRGLEDIRKDHQDDLADAARDLSDDETDIARDGARQRLEIERRLSQNRLSAKIEFQRQVADIERQFSQSAQEAAINVDAQAFRRAQTERANQLQDAQSTRDERVEDAEIAANQEREALKVQQQQAVDDAKIEYGRRVEAFKLSLEREIEAENLAMQRKLEDIRIAEEVKLQELAIKRLENLADVELDNQRQLESIERRLQQELAATIANAVAKADVEIAEAVRADREKERIAAAADARQRARANAAAAGRTPSGLGGIPILHDGGPLRKGQSAIVEAGERFFTAPANGVVVPQNQFSPAASLLGGGGSSTTTNNNTVNAGLTPEILDSPEMMFMVERMVNKAIGEIL